jgi:hypothetical protein
MSQLYPLQTPFILDERVKNAIENAPVPLELVKRIKEEFQKGTSMEALEDKYGVPVVRQVMGEKNEKKKKNINEKKENGNKPTDAYLGMLLREIADGTSTKDKALDELMKDYTMSREAAIKWLGNYAIKNPRPYKNTNEKKRERGQRA